jgi:hypothetical protein
VICNLASSAKMRQTDRHARRIEFAQQAVDLQSVHHAVSLWAATADWKFASYHFGKAANE